MANSIHVQLADAIASEINSTSRSWQTPVRLFTATQTWKPWYKSEAEIQAMQDAPKVAVVAMELNRKRDSRASDEWKFGITIDVQRYFDVSAVDLTTQVNALDKVCQDIQDWFCDGHTIMTGYIAYDCQRENVFGLDKFYAEGLWETMIDIEVWGHR